MASAFGSIIFGMVTFIDFLGAWKRAYVFFFPNVTETLVFFVVGKWELIFGGVFCSMWKFGIQRWLGQVTKSRATVLPDLETMRFHKVDEGDVSSVES